MNSDFVMEILGYVGTGLVLLSFLMTDVRWLRIVNMGGGFLSLIYAIYQNTMPVVVLNLAVMTINLVQLIRLSRKEREKAAEVNSDSADAYDNLEENYED